MTSRFQIGGLGHFQRGTAAIVPGLHCGRDAYPMEGGRRSESGRSRLSRDSVDQKPLPCGPGVVPDKGRCHSLKLRAGEQRWSHRRVATREAKMLHTSPKPTYSPASPTSVATSAGIKNSTHAQGPNQGYLADVEWRFSNVVFRFGLKSKIRCIRNLFVLLRHQTAPRALVLIQNSPGK
jgi:hypothetical protein